VGARVDYLENNVRQQQSALGLAQQKTADLSNLESIFDLSGKSGISAGLNGLFQSFSQLSITPNDAATRQNVITQASQLGQSFQNAASSVTKTAAQVQGEGSSAIDTVNQLAVHLARLNASSPRDFQGNVNPSVDAQMNNTLEELSKYVNYSAIQQPDGSVNVYIGGRAPLVMGSEAMPVKGNISSQSIAVDDSSGQDITSSITGGQLGGLLDVQNTKLPSYLTALNTLAQAVADQVNTTLSQGVDLNGAVPQNNLFTYSVPPGAAQSLAVNPVFTTDQIAAALSSAPGGNGNALNLSALANAKVVNGNTFTQFYGSLGSQVGQDLSNAQNDSDTANQLLTQTQTTRTQVSGVSLDQEAEQLIQFQRWYEAAAKLITVLDQLTSTAVNMIQA
jgi:flagellar hook-associated protein 1 FlgK